MRMISIDPGPHTGIARWGGEAQYNGLVLTNAAVFYNTEHTPGVIHFALTEELQDIDLVVCEDFIGNMHTKDEKSTIELIGFIKGWCWYRGIRLVMQAPAVRKGYIEFAKQLPVNVPTDIKKHSIDAIAHGLRYLHKEGIWVPQN